MFDALKREMEKIPPRSRGKDKQNIERIKQNP